VFLLGGTSPSLQATITSPSGAKTSVEKTRLMAPGRPGSITEGPEEQRGYHVKLEAPAATKTGIRVELKTVK
jgi:hypothetical protein